MARGRWVAETVRHDRRRRCRPPCRSRPPRVPGPALHGRRVGRAVGVRQEVDDTIALGDLGTHPLHLVANAFAFDHYSHLRVDLLAPGGPLERPAPPVTGDQLAAVADWILAGIPQMSPAAAVDPV